MRLNSLVLVYQNVIFHCFLSLYDSGVWYMMCRRWLCICVHFRFARDVSSFLFILYFRSKWWSKYILKLIGIMCFFSTSHFLQENRLEIGIFVQFNDVFKKIEPNYFSHCICAVKWVITSIYLFNLIKSFVILKKKNLFLADSFAFDLPSYFFH